MSRTLLRLGTLVCSLTAGLTSGSAHAIEPVVKDGSELSSPTATTNKPAPNSVFLEGMGSGLFYSLNYERRVIDDVGVRAGFSYLSMSSEATTGGTTASASSTYVTVPITASYLGVRGRRSGLEVGGGLTLAYASGSASTGVSSASGSGMTPIGTAMVGYRLHPVDGAGFQLRVGVMAMAAKGFSFDPDPNKFGVLPWMYLSMGAAF